MTPENYVLKLNEVSEVCLDVFVLEILKYEVLLAKAIMPNVIQP